MEISIIIMIYEPTELKYIYGEIYPLKFTGTNGDLQDKHNFNPFAY